MRQKHLALSLFATLAIAPIQIQPAIAQDGSSGRNGPSPVLFLNPQQPTVLDLSGGDGGDGASFGVGWLGSLIGLDRPSDRDDDSIGSRCYNSDVGHVSRDVTMPAGKSGPDGGDGGDGGNGGDLTVYYQNRSDLRTLTVNAAPGRGGRGGSGGVGQRGCKCPQYTWTRNDKTYKCTDGSDGSKGSNGSGGRSGRVGRLTLIQGTKEIPGDAPEIRTELSQLLARGTMPLTLNRWTVQKGAQGLLGAGSVVDDDYREYRDRLEKTVTVKWRATSPLANYGTQAATVKLQESGAIGFDFADLKLWSVLQQTEGPQGTQVAIDAVVHESEVRKMALGLTENRRRDFTLALLDQGGRAALVNSQFWVRIRTIADDTGSGYTGSAVTRYEGDVPAELVKRDYNRFVLNLGGLPVSRETFKKGVRAEVEIRVVRSLGARSTRQTLTWNGTVY